MISLCNLPSLGTIQQKGYWASLPVLLFAGVVPFLYYLTLIMFAVPVVGAFSREPKWRWRLLSLGSLCGAITFSVMQARHLGVAGLMFYSAEGLFGYPEPQINFKTFLGVGLILMPLSALIAVDRIRKIQD